MPNRGAFARILIGPWEHPLFLIVTPFIYAIAAGRCCIVKPNEESSHCAGIVSRIMKDYFVKASHMYRVMFGGSCVSNTILSLNWAVNGAQHNQSSMNISRPSITLNIGSKTPVFIDRSTTDLESCARRILKDKMERSGQALYSPDYVLVEEGETFNLLVLRSIYAFQICHGELIACHHAMITTLPLERQYQSAEIIRNRIVKKSGGLLERSACHSDESRTLIKFLFRLLLLSLIHAYYVVYCFTHIS